MNWVPVSQITSRDGIKSRVVLEFTAAEFVPVGAKLRIGRDEFTVVEASPARADGVQVVTLEPWRP